MLKDDEVDRLERASKAAVGDSREDVMESMYGRLNPKPAGRLPLLLVYGKAGRRIPSILAAPE